MTTTEYVANTARAFMAAEIAMASVNSGVANITRAHAEKRLDDYFARVEQVIPWTENNPLDRRSRQFRLHLGLPRRRNGTTVPLSSSG